MVDGKETPSLAKTVKVSAGSHRLLMNCLMSEAPSLIPGTATVLPGKQTVQTVGLTGELLPNARYFVRCERVEGTPTIWLSDSVDGPPLPGFVR
jgi:hypothetical protein